MPPHRTSEESTITDTRPRETRWVAIATLALGIFILITIEELPIGVLPLMAEELGASTGLAGLSVTVPGVLAGVVSLLTPVLIGRLDRRLVLAAALVSVIASCLGSFLAPSLVTLLASRLFAGIAIGLYWAVLPVVALRQAPAQRSAVALTGAFSGIGAALVLGIPLSAWIGQAFGWRASFALVAGAAAVVLGLLLAVVRPVRVSEAVPLRDMGAAIAVPGLRAAVALTFTIVTAQFISYSYVNPILQELSGVPAARISMHLLSFGIAGLVGNAAITPVMRRSPSRAVLVVAIGICLSLLSFATLGRSPVTAAILLPVWGLFAGAVSVSIQAFVSRVAQEVEEAGTALNAAIYNISIALGAALGGLLVDGWGLLAALLASICLMAVGAGIAISWHGRRRSEPGPGR